MICSLPDALRETALRFPDHEAVRWQGDSLTWAELWRQACHLASILRCKGVQRGDRVAIYMSKSVQSVLAIYAIMKAGAAYIPLDPSAPIDRLRSIVEDSRVRCLLTNRKKLEDALRLQCGDLACRGIGSMGLGEILTRRSRPVPMTSRTYSTPPGPPARRKALSTRIRVRLPSAHGRPRNTV